MSYAFGEGRQLFAGVHKGFSPPGPGSGEETLPEEALHYELGSRLFGQTWATTLVGLLMSCTGAYAFSRFRFPGRQAGLTALLLTQIFPGVVMVIPLYILLEYLHLLDTHTGLILIYSTTTVPFCTWMLKGYFDTIPKEMDA